MDQQCSDRRAFLQSATVMAAGAGATAIMKSAAALQAGAIGSPVEQSGPITRRWTEQRWLLDNIIRANGMDWDQPRSMIYSAPCGPEADADFAAIRARVQKYADISPAFEATARRREAKAQEAQAAGDLVTARENYFMAAVHWAASQWTFETNSEHNLASNARKRECYSRYAGLSEHRVEPAWIRLPGGRRLPGWFHLPPRYQSGRIPAIVSIPGMDGFKEASIAMYGDRWLSRGIAALALEGPGQYEAAVGDVHVSISAWQATGRAVMEWLLERSEIDPERIGIVGSSFGSLFSTIAAAAEPRFRAIGVAGPCLEPGCHTLFEEASPTFKMRFMYMSGIRDEREFDLFRQGLTWEGHVERIRVPCLCIAGEADELSPLVYTERFMNSLRPPRQLVVYQDSRHAVGGVPAANLGPSPPILLADWMNARLAGQPLRSERWFVESSGLIVKKAFP